MNISYSLAPHESNFLEEKFKISKNKLEYDLKGNESTDFFANVYDLPMIKIALAAIYMFAGVSFFALYNVASFERSGQAGQFRTVVNQLMSFTIDGVSIIFDQTLGS